MNGSMPTANIMALGVKRPREEGEMEYEEEEMLPREFSGAQFAGDLGANLNGQPRPIAQDPYGIPSQEDPNNMAGRVFTPGVGWKKLPTM